MGGKKGGAGENSKKAAGQARKADAAASKKAAEEFRKAAVEEAEWDKGSKKSSAKKDADAARKEEAARRKAERDALLAEEEKSLPARSAPKNAKTAQKKTRGLDLSQLDIGGPLGTLNASGIDNALDALSITTADNAAKIDRHPERRAAKARFAFVEKLEKQWEAEGVLKEKKRYRGAYHDEIQKLWLRSPDNPKNQVTAAYNATQDELAEIQAQEKNKVEQRLGEV